MITLFWRVSVYTLNIGATSVFCTQTIEHIKKNFTEWKYTRSGHRSRWGNKLIVLSQNYLFNELFYTLLLGSYLSRALRKTSQVKIKLRVNWNWNLRQDIPLFSRVCFLRKITSRFRARLCQRRVLIELPVIIRCVMHGTRICKRHGRLVVAVIFTGLGLLEKKKNCTPTLKG